MKLKIFKHRYFEYGTVIKYLMIFATMVIFNKLEKSVFPYSTAVFSTAMALNTSVFTTPILFLLSFIVYGKFDIILSMLAPVVVFITASLVYRKFGYRKKLLFSLFTALSLVLYVIIGSPEVSLFKRITVLVISSALTLVSIVAFSAVSEKGLKFKLTKEEFATVAVMVSLLGLGISNALTPLFWKAVCIALILFSAYFLRTGITSIVSTVFGITFAIYYGNIAYVGVYLVLSLAAESVMPLSRYLSALLIVLADYIIQAVFKISVNYQIMDFIVTVIGGIVFSVFPSKILKNAKEKLYSFREKQLVRESINRNRILVSNRLYEISGVFAEMSAAFTSFKENGLSEQSAKNAIVNGIKKTVCNNCPNFSSCRDNESVKAEDFDKLLTVGLAKNKLSLIDIPKNLETNCIRINDILYGINKLISEYKSKNKDNYTVMKSRELIASEINGVSDVLRSLALESGTLLKYQNRLERITTENLYKNGFKVSELLIYGDEYDLSVGLILTMREFNFDALVNVLSKTFGFNMTLIEKNDITEDKCYLSFKRAPKYDAVFGVSFCVKDGSKISGDTHAVSRIKEDKFLVALSDGMGSGEKAEKVSSTSLSLIESFYKAGMKSELILGTVNKLLAINTEDSFAALDISCIDLKTASADFIKYGAPIGFIINDNGVRIIEGNNLPLGILEELKPSVAHANLNDGDILLFLTDGITDAFGSSTEIIDFLRIAPCFNPQTLTDAILDRALTITKGAKKDDMTALAVRIFNKCDNVI